MFLLDILDNMPHLRLSNDHMRSVLWMLQELDVPDTPSFYALQETQKKLADEMDIQPREHISALGGNFHVVAPEDLLALVYDSSHQIRMNYLRHTGLGQPSHTKHDASVPGSNLLNWRIMADREMAG